MLILTAGNTINSIAQFITVFVIFIGVLALTWFVTKWTASFQKGRLSGNNVEVLETFKISQNQYVEIIRITDKYLAIAVGKDSVTVLTELEEDTIIRKANVIETKIDFKELLEKVKEKQHGKISGVVKNEDE